MKKKILFLGLCCLGAIAVLSGCAGKKAGATKVTTVTIAESPTSPPYAYRQKGELTGFEIEILQKIDKDLPNYHFKYKNTDPTALLTTLDSGRAQIAADNFGKTKERESKYLFSAPLAQGVNAIFSNKSEHLTTIASLAGKSVALNTGTNYGDIVNQWNAKHPTKKITIQYTNGTLESRLEALNNGSGADFLFASAANGEQVMKAHAQTNVMATVPTDLNKYPIFKTYEYFVLAAGQEKLQKAMDKEITKFAKDGTLKALSEKYYGDDQVPAMSLYR